MMISLNKAVVVAVIASVVVAAAVIPGLIQDPVNAKTTKKVHFTETVTSAQDPGQGHEGRQLALLLSPQDGIIYDGSLTFTADRPVQVMVLHEIGSGESRGQPVWTVDGKTVYGLSLLGAGSVSDSFEFTGAALALSGPDAEPFAATASVDGWVRGGAIEFVAQEIMVESPPAIDLYRAGVPATIPMHTGLYDGNQTLYIITDSSDGSVAGDISEKQDWTVAVAPPLSDVPESILGEIYIFANGVRGGGLHGFQNEVLSSTPEQRDDYSALRKVINVSWKLGQNSETLDSVEDVMQAQKNGRIEIEETETVLNTPQILWPGGQLQIRDGDAADDGATHEGGQVLGIDTENSTVTFAAHRGWGPDGRTVYYIVTGATPSGPAEMRGVVDSPASAELSSGPATADIYQFKNGLESSGLLGFQPGIATAAPGDDAYSPMWRVFLVEWNREEGVGLLETVDDVDAARAGGLVTVSIARPTNAAHIVNLPFIDPFQNPKG